jgi:hypothetical protein
MSLFDDIERIGLENEDDISVNLESFSDAVIWGTDWTTETVVTQLNRGNIELNPKFQRREAWDKVRKSRFIESIILGLPIPQIILAEKKDKKGTYIVIDGKQRLLSIRQFFSKSDDTEFPVLKLAGLDSLQILNGISYQDLKKNPQFSDFASSVENQSIRTIVIKNWPNEDFLFNVFLRLNTGSLQLSPQELRQALHPGPFIDFSDEFSINSNQIKTVLKINKPDYRMRDVELVIRYFANKFFIDDYNGNLKRFFDETVKTLNASWNLEENNIKSKADELNFAIDATSEIFESNAFNKWKGNDYQKSFNRAIFDIMVYYFSTPEIRTIALTKKSEIETRFRLLCESDIEFLQSFETSTKNVIPTNKRFNTWGNNLKEILAIDFHVPNLIS